VIFSDFTVTYGPENKKTPDRALFFPFLFLTGCPGLASAESSQLLAAAYKIRRAARLPARSFPANCRINS
jgi:hypothetical protein